MAVIPLMDRKAAVEIFSLCNTGTQKQDSSSQRIKQCGLHRGVELAEEVICMIAAGEQREKPT